MPRFYVALLGALALHGLLLLVRSRPDAGLAQRAPEQLAEQFIDIDDTLVGAAPAASPVENSHEESAGSHVTGSVSARLAVRIPRTESRIASSLPLLSGPDASSSDAVATGVAAPAGQADGTLAVPERKVDLGLDGHFFLGPPSEMFPRMRRSDARPPQDPQKRLENALAADDVQRGLARGNALVGSLRSAAREAGPLRGAAMFRVTVGANGEVLSAELVNGDGSDWAAALSAFRALVAQKRLRVPPGARGLRVTFSVKAKVQRPSGKEVDEPSVGIAGPSANPNGLVPHGDFDLTDLTGSGQRLVYARVVSEEVL